MLLRTPRVAVSALFFFNGALFGSWASRVPSVRAALDLGEGELGLYLLCMALGAILSFPLAGRLADEIGAARTSRLVAIAHGPALAMVALASEPWHLAPLLFFLGACHGGMDVAMNAFGAEVERARGRSIMVSFHAMWSVGAGCGAGIGALAILNGLSVATHFSLFALMTAIPALWLSAIPWQGITGRGQKSPLIALPRGSLILVGMLGFCAMIGEGAIADWGAIFLVDVLKAGEAYAALGFTFFSIFMVTFRFAGDRLVVRFGPSNVARVGGVVAASGILTVVLAPNVAVAWAGFALTGAGMAPLAPLVYSRAASDPVISPGAGLASVSTLGYGSLLLGPPLVGAIAEGLSLSAGFVFLAMMALMVSVLAPSLRSDRA